MQVEWIIIAVTSLVALALLVALFGMKGTMRLIATLAVIAGGIWLLINWQLIRSWISGVWDDPVSRSFGAAAALLVVYAWVSRPARRVTIRVGAVGIVVGLVAYAVYLLLSPQLNDPENGVRLTQALLAGGVIAAGWLVSFAVQELRAEHVRWTTQHDLLLALGAEIADLLRDAKGLDIESGTRKMAEDIRNAADNAPHYPFITTPKSLAVFEALTSQVPMLPRDVTMALVAFVTEVRDASRMAADLQSEDYRAASKEDRIAFLLEYSNTRRAVVTRADKTLAEINRALPLFSRKIAHPTRGGNP